ncbi:MAG: YihY/virulence factor BrkB family protein [Actinomycetota bacterium]|nr:YihY/virulence factor BrkB family protein [Actinomycetota bacterium]
MFRLGAIGGQPEDTCVTAQGHQVANLGRPEQAVTQSLRAGEWSPRGPLTLDGPQANPDMSRRRLGGYPPMGRSHDSGSNARDAVPNDPTDLSGGSWLAAARRALKEYKADDLQDRAAALTYFGIQSIFPGLLVLVSLLGILGKSATQPLITNLSKAAPSSVRKIIMSDVTHPQASHAASGILGIAGIVLALWSASNYVAAFMRASNVIYDVPEGRPIWKTAPIRLCVTVVTLVLLVAAAVIVVVTGGLAQKAGNVLGLGSTAVTVWDIAKWPVLLIIIGLILAILFWASPNARHGFQWVSPGGFIAVVLWLAASGLFALYVANFSHYNKIYGSLAGVIIFLIWMWISNVAILLGAEFNAELERGRAIAAGHPAGQEPFSELRDDRKLRKEKRRSRS